MPRRVFEFQPSPPWGRGWSATGAFISRGGPGEGVPTRPSSPIKCRCARCRRGFIGEPAVNAVALLPIPSVSRSRRSRWTWLSWVVANVFVGFTVLTPSPVAPRLARTLVARHPLPQGGEGMNSKQHAAFSPWPSTPIENIETPALSPRERAVVGCQQVMNLPPLGFSSPERAR
jgi:hypothetical protein